MSSGWIKFGKGLPETMKFRRLAKAVTALLVTRYETLRALPTEFVETWCLGSLCKLWRFADSHIREDDTLDITLDEIDELVGLKGFAALVPRDWLQVLDADTVKLPKYQAHNRAPAKEAEQGRVRQQRFRDRKREAAGADDTRNNAERNALRVGVTDVVTGVTPLDQTRPLTLSLSAQAQRAFEPGPEERLALAAERPDVDLDLALRKFRDHTFDPPIDPENLLPEFRNWVRREIVEKRRNGGGGGSGGKRAADAPREKTAAQMAEDERLADAARRTRERYLATTPAAANA